MWRYFCTVFILTTAISKNVAFPQKPYQPFEFSSADGFLFPGSVNSNRPSSGIVRPQGINKNRERVTSPPMNGNPQNFQQCFNNCPTTSQFNPICGTDGVDYENQGKLKCAQYCGKTSVGLAFLGRCQPLLPSVG
ncbi:uncharacterized protein LOC117171911 [Belonocnema kinseyi]|uniref:uncharacterized protein LOC117171911 n=1 Tax=Belonocnema kinseyi TaxID=2817044 RepID=UPI00143D78F6|nr:uncharacterized protein LOC117171911 [Belonocnema kinseyi]